MLQLTGYADRWSAAPGDPVRFHVNSEHDRRYRADIVRLVHGDQNPAGPGFKEEELAASVNGEYPGRRQRIDAGSYVLVGTATSFDLESLTLQAFVWPTTPGKGAQGLLTKWLEDEESGYGLFVGADGATELWIGNGEGAVERVSSGVPLQSHVWHLVAASFDGATGGAVVYQYALPSVANGGLAASLLDPRQPTEVAHSERVAIRPGRNAAPFLLAASAAEADSGRRAYGAHYREAPEPLVLPVQSACFNGKLDMPAVARRSLSPTEIWSVASGLASVRPSVRSAVIGCWDFSANITGQGVASVRVVDTSAQRVDGYCINLPARGMTGHNWTGDEISYVHAPQEYGAIHFHDDDVDDARWEVDFEWIIPESVPSGIYAARLRIDEDDDDPLGEDYVSFVVTPPRGSRRADVALIVPTATYLAYANQNSAFESSLAEAGSARVVQVQGADLYLNEHREYGLSIYGTHFDGSGNCYSSGLRPNLNIRPKYRNWSFPWGLAADLHLTDWLERKGIAFDVWTDVDLHREGVDLLSRYRVTLTGTHPEYASEEMLSAYAEYQQEGGRWLYLGGNGFYWVTVFHPDNPNIIEVRRSEAGTRPWTASPGEYSNAFDGRFGGMWRARGRMPSKLCGVTFNAYGFDVSSYYRRCPDSYRPECAWIFEGVDTEVIGDFGLLLGGAAGLEIDRYDLRYGTPSHALLLARSEGHSDLMLEVTEELHSLIRGYHGGGDENPLIRADMVYYTTPKGGAVFTPGSIAWCGSLSWNDYDNSVSRITENVIRGFLTLDELP